ncbi:MAG TPA: hypothetical protein VJ461_05235 [Candidatus Nanoarchaeia archaeon]|nr:hypothetical protein [Candidatus Nanoarchaeia archaeon]
MNKQKNTTLFILGFLALFSLLTALVLADSDYPYPVRTITPGASSRANLSRYVPANLTNVMAGNITEINLSAISSTKAWAGYYGEITGTITLEDAAGYVFYNWTALEPKGEIYASPNATITWSSIGCFEYGAGITLETAEDWFGMEDDDADGINETFTDNSNTYFEVGGVDITAATCPATQTFQNGGKVVGNFENVLLTDGAALVFVTFIENDDTNNATDIQGYNGLTHDFQLLVAENGHDGGPDTTPTMYYFWAEIE